ncbi:hypothetical protein [Actinoplanes sp. NBRC 101535]|uniref:hypothetical protein n=1 Tax=Actinoplanes sp. NBRC 101535 TaxID=3032196 RepID=UPI00255262A7|nr:hypothetical protein [Actinoplanes sp. NBRC 101535]
MRWLGQAVRWGQSVTSRVRESKAGNSTRLLDDRRGFLAGGGSAPQRDLHPARIGLRVGFVRVDLDQLGHSDEI